jgi:fructan beta-fructosidase
MKKLFGCVFVTAFITGVLIGCGQKEKQIIPAETPSVYDALHRPLVHFSLKENWMNDPNGMFYLDGEYHLFFQYYPDSTVWGPMHWGHAISKDLVHWEQLPIALAPDSLGYIFSGSAVVDTNNTSGLGKPGQPAIVALFTYHDASKERAGGIDFQSQGMAYSTDKGRSWTKYEHNPVVPNPGIQDFRDPKVSWNEKAKQWVMTLAVKDHIEFYGSVDLKIWKKLSEFGKTEGEHGGVWECPELMQLKDEGGRSRDVLLVSMNPGAPNGGSGTQYFIGNFDGKKFVSDTPGENAGWMDYGTDNYAGVTFDNIPSEDGRRILMGWMNNWNYAQVIPTDGWRGANTIPRVLSLRTIQGIPKLVSTPVSEMANLASSSKVISSFRGDTLDVGEQIGFSLTPAVVKGKIRKSAFVIEIFNTMGQQISIGLDQVAKEFYVDRSKSGKTSFYPEFRKIIKGPRNVDDAWVSFTVIIDASSIEVFFDDGATSMTTLCFPEENFSGLKIYGKGNSLETDTISVTQLQNIWQQK